MMKEPGSASCYARAEHIWLFVFDLYSSLAHFGWGRHGEGMGSLSYKKLKEVRIFNSRELLVCALQQGWREESLTSLI